MFTCQFENGNTTQNLRHVSVGVIVLKDNNILLERRAQNLANGGKIAIPGGYVDQNERISDAAAREVFEETGYRVKDVTLFLVNDLPGRKQENYQNIEFNYVAAAGEKEGDGDNESSELFWVSLDNLPPEKDWAYDHFEEVMRYKLYLKNPCPLPITSFSY